MRYTDKCVSLQLRFAGLRMALRYIGVEANDADLAAPSTGRHGAATSIDTGA